MDIYSVVARQIYERWRAREAPKKAGWDGLSERERGTWRELAALASNATGDTLTEVVGLAVTLIDERSSVAVERGRWQGLERDGELYRAIVGHRQGFGKTAAEALHELRGELLGDASERVRRGRHAAGVVRGVLAGRFARGEAANDG